MAEVADIRLTIEAPKLFIGDFRYTVLQRYGEGGLFAVIDLGSASYLQDAIQAAEQAAAALAT